MPENDLKSVARRRKELAEKQLKLDAETRLAIVKARGEGKTYTHIARVLGMSLSSVRHLAKDGL
jgi:DNA-directed RNA polymerase specialized sigma24 family protein